MQVTSQLVRPWSYLTWPDRITLLRLLLVAPFVMLVRQQQSHPAQRYLALGVFVLLALSDLADGVLARKLGCQSRLGAILDPLADKTLIICAVVLLAMPSYCVPGARLPDWVVVLVVGKDLWVIVGFVVVFLVTGSIRVQPTLPGKLCTAGQLIMVSAVLVSPDLNRLGYHAGSRLAAALWWGVSGMSVLSVLAYTRLGVMFVAEADRPDGAGREDSAGKAA